MIIDTHVHIGKLYPFDMKKEQVLYSMERYGISYSIVSDIRAAEFDHDLNPVPEPYRTPQAECAASVIRFAKENPGRIGAALWLRPFSEKADDEIRQIISENRDVVKALKMHPFHSTVPFDSPEMDPFVELAREFSLPIVSHTGGSDAASCLRVFRMAERNPDVNFVMVHMGLGTDNTEAIDLAGKLPNLWGDTTWVPVRSVLRFIEKNGDDRIVFGSDSPIDGPDTYLHNRTGDRSLYQEYFHELPKLIPVSSYEKLMHGNAERLFRIKI